MSWTLEHVRERGGKEKGGEVPESNAQGFAVRKDEAQILSHVALAKQLLRARDKPSPEP